MHEWQGRHWEGMGPNTPFLAPASATTVQQVVLTPRTSMVAIVLSNAANVTSVAVTGVGTGLSYLPSATPPSNGLIVFPVLPSIDDVLSISVVVGGSGSCFVYADLITVDLGWGTQSIGDTPGALGPFPAAIADSDADPNATTTVVRSHLYIYRPAAARWVRPEIPSDADGSAYGSLFALSVGPMVKNGGNARTLRGLPDAGDGTGVPYSIQPSSVPVGAAGGAGVGATLTIAGVAAEQIRLTSAWGSYSGAAAGGVLTATDGTITIAVDLASGNEATLPCPPGGFKFTAGASVTVSLSNVGALTSHVGASYLIA